MIGPLVVVAVIGALIAALWVIEARRERQRDQHARAIIAALAQGEPHVAALLMADAARLHNRLTAAFREDT